MAFCTISRLSSRSGVDVDRGVGEEQRAWVGRDVQREDVAHPAGRAKAGVLGNHLVHQLVRVQAPLHQGLDLAATGQRHRGRRRRRAVLAGDQFVRREVDIGLLRDRPDLRLGADQERDDQAGLGGVGRAQERVPVDRVHDRRAKRLQPLGEADELPEACLGVVDVNVGKDGARTLHLLRRRDHLGGAGDDGLALLVRTRAIEGDAVPLRVLRLRRDRHGDAVARRNGPPEAQRLPEVDGAGAGELRPQEGGDERPAPHPVGDDLVEHVAPGVLLVHVGRVDVPRHRGEDADIILGKGADEAGGVADLDLVEGPVLDVVHGSSLAPAARVFQ